MKNDPNSHLVRSTILAITNPGRHSVQGVDVIFERSPCSNPEQTSATLTVISRRKIRCVLVKCETTGAVIAHEPYNGIKNPPSIEFLETEEHGPYTVEVS